MELARGCEGGVDDGRGHPMAVQIEEAHVLARVPDLPGHRLEAFRLAAKGGETSMTGMTQMRGRFACQAVRGAVRVTTRWRSFASSKRSFSYVSWVVSMP